MTRSHPLLDPAYADAETFGLPPLPGPEALDVASVRAAEATRPRAVGPAPTPIFSVTAADGHDVELRRHGVGGRAAVVWLHGGGMFLGSAAHDDELCTRLAHDLGVPVYSVDYRLAPKHRHPEPLRDALAAVDETAAPGRAANLGEPPPVYLDCGDADLFVDDVRAFMSRLAAVDGLHEWHLIPGPARRSADAVPH